LFIQDRNERFRVKVILVKQEVLGGETFKLKWPQSAPWKMFHIVAYDTICAGAYHRR
jgi:hypothetical protein